METKTKRRNFDEAFKRDAVKLLLQGDKPLKLLAADLGVSHWNLRDWKRRYGPPPPLRSTEVLETELRARRRENEHLRAQRDILKKTLGILAERFARMKILETEHLLADRCAALGVSRSGYHAWKTRPPSARQRADQTLSQSLCQAHTASRQTYGSPRLRAVLRQQGHRTRRRRVRRLMRQHELRALVPRRFVPQTTDRRHDQPIAPNRLAQALHQRQPAAGCVHHTDRGSQYASAVYRQQAARAGLLASLSRAGNGYDNAAMESFWGKLKTEWVHRREFASREAARLAIFEYVEVFYNRTRLHSALGYKSPGDFENQLN